MDCEWHSGAWIDVLNLPVPGNVPEAEQTAYRRQLEEYVDRCAMVLEDWDERDAEWLGDYRWGWADYERQLAYLCLEVEGFPDLRRRRFSSASLSRGDSMSAKPSNGAGPLTIARVLQAYFALDARAQRQVREEVRRLSAPDASEEELQHAEKRLAGMLRWAGMQGGAGRVLSREERLSPAQQELRARMEQTEAAFAAALARLMAERQLTQAQLAERVGVGQSAISMLLKRRCRPQRRTLGRLADALGVPVDELWPGFSAGWRSGVM